MRSGRAFGFLFVLAACGGKVDNPLADASCPVGSSPWVPACTDGHLVIECCPDGAHCGWPETYCDLGGGACTLGPVCSQDGGADVEADGGDDGGCPLSAGLTCQNTDGSCSDQQCVAGDWVCGPNQKEVALVPANCSNLNGGFDAGDASADAGSD